MANFIIIFYLLTHNQSHLSACSRETETSYLVVLWLVMITDILFKGIVSDIITKTSTKSWSFHQTKEIGWPEMKTNIFWGWGEIDSTLIYLKLSRYSQRYRNKLGWVFCHKCSRKVKIIHSNALQAFIMGAEMFLQSLGVPLKGRKLGTGLVSK